jgi:hypothetical protein
VLLDPGNGLQVAIGRIGKASTEIGEVPGHQNDVIAWITVQGLAARFSQAANIFMGDLIDILYL